MRKLITTSIALAMLALAPAAQADDTRRRDDDKHEDHGRKKDKDRKKERDRKDHDRRRHAPEPTTLLGLALGAGAIGLAALRGRNRSSK